VTKPESYKKHWVWYNLHDLYTLETFTVGNKT